MTSPVPTIATRLRGFCQDQGGAVTVDWVVLTAAVVGITIMLFTILTPAIFSEAGTVIADGITQATARP